MSELNLPKDLVLVVLVDAQIPFGDLERGVIVNVHQDSRMNAPFPGVIAECLSQGMAADVIREAASGGGAADDAVGLAPVDGLSRSAALENVIRAGGHPELPILLQRLREHRIQRDTIRFPRFAFDHLEVCPAPSILKIVYGVPPEPEEIADPQRGVEAHGDQQAVPRLQEGVSSVILL